VSKPELTARTITGYYDEPAHQNHPWEARRVTVAQLEQMLERVHGSKDNEVAQEISGVELTERMSSTRLSSWKGRLTGERSRAALVAVEDASSFQVGEICFRRIRFEVTCPTGLRGTLLT
jgi:hypothetical protein